MKMLLTLLFVAAIGLERLSGDWATTRRICHMLHG